MAYTPIPDYVTNQLITAAHGNTYWKNNFAALFPYTTIGDVAYASATNALSRLGIGTAGQVLSVNAGATAPEWASGTSILATQFLSQGSGTIQTTTSTNVISGTITLPSTSNVILIGSGIFFISDIATVAKVCLQCNGTNQTWETFTSSTVYQNFGHVFLFTSVPAGSRSIKIIGASGNPSYTSYFQGCGLLAIAF